METYFIAIRVAPLPDNPLAKKVEERLGKGLLLDRRSCTSNRHGKGYSLSRLIQMEGESMEKGTFDSNGREFAE